MVFQALPGAVLTSMQCKEMMGMCVCTSTYGSPRRTQPLGESMHNYGYAQQKAQITRYHIYDYSTTPQCTNVVTTDYGYLDAITAYPFFSECHATSPCTPQP